MPKFWKIFFFSKFKTAFFLFSRCLWSTVDVDGRPSAGFSFHHALKFFDELHKNIFYISSKKRGNFLLVLSKFPQCLQKFLHNVYKLKIQSEVFDFKIKQLLCYEKESVICLLFLLHLLSKTVIWITWSYEVPCKVSG